MRWGFLAVWLLACGKVSDAPPGPIGWLGDDALAARTAAATGRRGLVFAGAVYDHGSKDMEHAFEDVEVRRSAARYVPLFVDVTDSDEPAARRQIDRFGVQGTPTLLLLAPDFRTEIYRASTFVPPERLASILQYAGDGAAPPLSVRANYELHRPLLERIRDRILAEPLLDPLHLPPARSCWAEASPATAACLRAEDERRDRLADEQRQIERVLLPELVAGTAIVGLRVRRSAGYANLVVGAFGTLSPEQKRGTRNVEVGVMVDERTTLGWGDYRLTGDRAFHPGLEVLWQNGETEITTVLVDGQRRL